MGRSGEAGVPPVIGSCGACPAKDQIIEDLRHQLEETQKTLLALADARAYQLRHPAERAAAPPAEPAKPMMTPARSRQTVYQPREGEMTPEQVEQLFRAEEDLQRRIDSGS